jgi:uncharacterized Zn-binding protein involved in type VI secretion
MAKRALIRKGDKTTHGGEVLTGDETFIVEGRAVARVGDSVSCPRCRGTHQIVTGAPTMFSPQMMARHDDLTDCGAKLIASQFTDTVDDGDDGVASAGATLSSMPEPRAAEAVPDEQADASLADPVEFVPSPALAEGPLGLRFQAVNPEGSPLARRPYIITHADGTQHGGLTDAQGYTLSVDADDPVQLAVHFMFVGVEGATINREDLLP